jgi:hypothetical protein
MDSWTPAQLNLMKAGGNARCATYLQQKGIPSGTPIKEKYESPAAQLYKEVLKARVEGRPEPTELPKVAPRSGTYNNTSANSSTFAAPKPGEDPNGMERLTGESDQQYIARQTRLRDEARQRMAAKFGGGSSNMGGVGSSRMAGIGSDPHYNPNAGFSPDLNVESLVSGFGSALTSFGSVAMGAAASATSLIKDEKIQSIGGSMWSTLTNSVSSVASTLTQPESDGLEEFHRRMASQRSAAGSKYEGFGSDNTMGNNNTMPSSSFTGQPYSNAAIQEAPGAPGEDRNGIERLTGESDEQYVIRQTRLRDEAKARMAAKFGNGGLTSASSSSSAHSSTLSSFGQNPPSFSAPMSGGVTSARHTPPIPATKSAPSSGNFQGAGPAQRKGPAVKLKVENDVDFFSSFGA